MTALPDTTPTPNPLYDAAVTYAGEWGVPVFPLWWVSEGLCGCGHAECTSPGKHPLTPLVPSGLTQATTDLDLIATWWRRYPQANVAIRTGEGLCVIDLDPRHGGTRDALPPLPDTLHCITGSGGEHIYFRVDVPVRNSAGKLAVGVDVRGDGGYVVAPPSQHASGEYYHWGDRGDTLATLPDELLTRLQAMPRPAEQHATTHGASRHITGGRNEALTRYAGMMRKRGFTEAAIRAALHEENRIKCHPPLEEREVEQIARGIMRYEPTEPVLTGDEAPDVWRWNSTVDVFSAPLDPPVWLCEGLQLGPGRPSGIVGYGGTGKSYIAQWLLLCLATGTPFLDLPVTQCRVRHVSWEMGRPATLERYRALANGMGVQVPAGGLEVSTHPSIYLTSEEAEEVFAAEFAGWDVVLLDSLRRTIPGVDENSSQVSQYLDILTRVSERIGTTFIVLHHSGKSPSDGSKRSPREAARGSSAITDALGAMWQVEGEGTGPRTMTHARAHEAAEGELEPIVLTLKYLTELQGRTYPGSKVPMIVTRVSDAEMQQARIAARIASGVTELDGRLEILVNVVRAYPGASLNQISGYAQMNRGLMNQCLDILAGEGRIMMKPGKGRSGGGGMSVWPVDEPGREGLELGDFAEAGE